MTGTSARETSRPAKRPRPSATDHPDNPAPPVLFRLPSVSQPAHDEDQFHTPTAMPHAAMAMGMAGSAASPVTAPTQVAAPAGSPRTAIPAAIPAAVAALASTKAAGQRLFNTLVVGMLLIALAIISLLALRGGQPAAQPELADSATPSQDLEALSNLHAPEISMPSPQTGNVPSASTTAAVGQEAATDRLTATNTSSSALQVSLDAAKSADGSGSGRERRGLTIDAADLAKKPSGAAAQVQLGTPVPMRSTALAASQESAPQAPQSSLPLTTPRYETVSTPSAAGSASGGSPSPDTGASPTLWDGAKKPAGQSSDVKAELLLSGANNSEMSLIPSDYSGSAAKPTNAQTVSSKSAPSASTGPQTTSSDSLGVTVGAGMAQPEFPQAKATATPDLDVAAISSQFLEYSRQKSVVPASTSTEIVNPYAPATAAVPATTASTNNYATGAYQQSPAGAGVPYGTTGAALTPYVRNAPTGAVPSGLGGATTSAMIPAAGSTQPHYPTGNPPVTMPGASPSTVYPSLSGAAYPQNAPNAGAGYNAGYSMPANTAGGFAIPPRGAATSATQMTAGHAAPATSPAQTGPYGYPAAQNYGYSVGTPGAPGTPGMMAPAGGASYPSATVSSSPYPGGQAPQGMIGQSGFATAPSGDVAAPIPVTGKIGYGTSPTR